MTARCETSDWVRDRRVSWLWPTAFVAVGVGWLAVTEPVGLLLTAAGFALAGALCAANAARCRRTHCIVTGPLYLLATLVLLSRVVGGVTMPVGYIVAASVVGTLLAYLPEWLGLRYVPRRGCDETPSVELLYDKDCPNAPEARANLARAFAAVGLPPWWKEREVSSSSPDTPPQAWGSPTVLVNGRDVAGEEPGNGASCRVYEAAGRRSGAPSTEVIALALAATYGRRP